jgi:hypothetical protein
MFIDLYNPDMELRSCDWLWRKWAVYYTYIVGPATSIKTVRLTKRYLSKRIAHQRLKILRNLVIAGRVDCRI